MGIFKIFSPLIASVLLRKLSLFSFINKLPSASGSSDLLLFQKQRERSMILIIKRYSLSYWHHAGF